MLSRTPKTGDFCAVQERLITGYYAFCCAILPASAPHSICGSRSGVNRRALEAVPDLKLGCKSLGGSVAIECCIHGPARCSCRHTAGEMIASIPLPGIRMVFYYCTHANDHLHRDEVSVTRQKGACHDSSDVLQCLLMQLLHSAPTPWAGWFCTAAPRI